MDRGWNMLVRWVCIDGNSLGKWGGKARNLILCSFTTSSLPPKTQIHQAKMATFLLSNAKVFLPCVPSTSSSSSSSSHSTIQIVCRSVAPSETCSIVTSRRGIALSLATAAGFLSGANYKAVAAILEADEDDELMEKVKRDRKKRLEINSSTQEKGSFIFFFNSLNFIVLWYCIVRIIAIHFWFSIPARCCVQTEQNRAGYWEEGPCWSKFCYCVSQGYWLAPEGQFCPQQGRCVCVL